MKNPSLERSLRALGHPLSLAALGLLFLNDHVLRQLWPSWWTGKLGDLAWLFFAPLAVAVAIALFLPRRWQRHTMLPAIAGFVLVGAVFVLGKTSSAGHDMVAAASEMLLGFPVGVRQDPTDLLALPALGGSALMWARLRTGAARPPAQARTGAGAGWVALGLAALLTVANSPAPDPGIFCVGTKEGKVYAFAQHGSFESVDGGMTWAASSKPQFDCVSPWEVADASQEVRDPAWPGIAYRFAPGQSIEISRDGSYQPAYDPRGMNEAEQALVQRRRGGNVTVRAVPMDGVIEERTGNAVFAMGHGGVLVNTKDGKWRTVSVASYRGPEALSVADFAELLVGEGLLATGALLLAFATLVLIADGRRRGWRVVLLAAGWLVWLGIVFLLGPARLSGYGAIIGYVALFALGVLVVASLIASTVRLGELPGIMRPAAGASVIAAVLFLLPYVLWATNAIPYYLPAAAFGVVLTLASVVAGSRWLRLRA